MTEEKKKKERKENEGEFIGRRVKRNAVKVRNFRAGRVAIDVLEDRAGEFEDAEACNVNKYAKRPRFICCNVMQFYIYILYTILYNIYFI